MGGGGADTPPFRPGFHRGGMKLQKEIWIWVFLVHKLLEFWVPGPPPPFLRRALSNPRNDQPAHAQHSWHPPPPPHHHPPTLCTRCISATADVPLGPFAVLSAGVVNTIVWIRQVTDRVKQTMATCKQMLSDLPRMEVFTEVCTQFLEELVDYEKEVFNGWQVLCPERTLWACVRVCVSPRARCMTAWTFFFCRFDEDHQKPDTPQVAALLRRLFVALVSFHILCVVQWGLSFDVCVRLRLVVGVFL